MGEEGRGRGRGMNTRAVIFFYTRHTVTSSSKEPYSLMKIFIRVFKIEGIVALNIKGHIKITSCLS